MQEHYFGKTYDEIFDKAFKTFSKGREEHEFHHYNGSLGMMIYSKEHLKHEMKKRNMLPLDLCEELAEEWQRKEDRRRGDYKPSAKAIDIISSLKMTADKNGNLKLGGRAIEALIEIGAIQPRREEIHRYGKTGGFDNA